MENRLKIPFQFIIKPSATENFSCQRRTKRSLFETRLNETYKILDVLIKHGRKGTNLHTWPSPKIWGPSVGLGVLTTGQVDYRLI
jgi:hypothetical protein